MSRPLIDPFQSPDPNNADNPTDFITGYQGRPPVPTNFIVSIADDRTSIKLSVVDSVYPRNQISEYRFYFAPGELVGWTSLSTPPSSASYQLANSAFGQARFVDSLSAPNKGETIQLWTQQYVGKPGFWFCTSVWQDGHESYPTPAAITPTATGSTDNSLPPDPVGFQVSLSSVQNVTTTLVQVSFSCGIPAPLGSFAGVQIYFNNYQNSGQIEEGPFFALGSGIGGGTLTGSFLLEPDTPTPYSTGTVTISNGSPDVVAVGAPQANWLGGWDNRPIWFYGVKNNTDQFPSLFSKTINTVVNNAYLRITDIAPTYPNQNFVPYAILPGNVSNVAHTVTFFAVAIAQGGNRRADPQNAPQVVFPFGVSTALSMPQQPPFSLIATLQGVTVSLSWTPPIINNLPDPSIANFNIYRVRAGTMSNYIITPPAGGWPTGAIFDTVMVDKSLKATGAVTTYGYVDRRFQNDATQPNYLLNYDFNPVDPAVYIYWITSVNIEGTENHGIGGGLATVNAGSPTVTWNAGDLFSQEMQGGFIQVNGETFTILTVNSPTVITANGNFVNNAANKGYIAGWCWVVTPPLNGNSGGENHPTIYRDTFYNRLWNAQFYTTNGAADVALTYAEYCNNVGYNLGVGLSTDNQYAYDNDELGANAAYKIPRAGLLTGNSGKDPYVKIGASTKNGDGFSIWNYGKGGAGLTPKWKSNGTNMTGDIECDSSGTTNPDYSGIRQFAFRRQYLSKENVVSSIYVKRGAASAAAGTQVGYLSMQMGLWDESVPGEVGGTFNATTFSLTQVTSTATYNRFSLVYVMPDWATYNDDKYLVDVKYTIQSDSKFKYLLTRPMVNGGLLGAQWTAMMNPGDIPGGSSGTGGGIVPDPPYHCIHGDTMILVDKDAWLPVRHLKPGHLIMSWAGPKVGYLRRTVQSIRTFPTNRLVRIFTGGDALVCTPSHKVGVRAGEKRLGYVAADTIRPGDKIMLANGTEPPKEGTVTAVDAADVNGETIYAITLNATHNYISNGILSHNKPIES